MWTLIKGCRTKLKLSTVLVLAFSVLYVSHRNKCGDLMGRKLCGQSNDVGTQTQKASLVATIRGSGTAYVQCILGLINLSKAEGNKIWLSRVNTPPPTESDEAGDIQCTAQKGIEIVAVSGTP